MFVGQVSYEAKELVSVAKECMDAGIQAAGEPLAKYLDIGNAIQGIAEEYGYSVVEDYWSRDWPRFPREPTIYIFETMN